MKLVQVSFRANPPYLQFNLHRRWVVYSARIAAIAARAAPADPARCSAPPVNALGVADGTPVIIGFVPLPAPAMLLTIKDGHGVDSVMAGIDRVIIRSGMVVGQEVPQGAETVVYAKTFVSPLCFRSVRTGIV